MLYAFLYYIFNRMALKAPLSLLEIEMRQLEEIPHYGSHPVSLTFDDAEELTNYFRLCDDSARKGLCIGLNSRYRGLELMRHVCYEILPHIL